MNHYYSFHNRSYVSLLSNELPNYSLKQSPHVSSSHQSKLRSSINISLNDRDSQFQQRPVTCSSVSSSLNTGQFFSRISEEKNDIEYKGTRSIYNNKYKFPRDDLTNQLDSLKDSNDLALKRNCNSQLHTPFYKEQNDSQIQLRGESTYSNNQSQTNQRFQKTKPLCISQFEIQSDSLANYSSYLRVDQQRKIYSNLPKSPLSQKEMFFKSPELIRSENQLKQLFQSNKFDPLQGNPHKPIQLKQKPTWDSQFNQLASPKQNLSLIKSEISSSTLTHSKPTFQQSANFQTRNERQTIDLLD